MKNTITYYYNLNIDNYKKREKKIIFSSNKIEYEFVEYFGNVINLMELYSLLKYNRKITDEIILNKNNDIVTYFDKKPYILLRKSNYNSNKKLTLNELAQNYYLVHNKTEIRWKELWEEKIDYYEVYLNEIKVKYPLLKESFYYYLGLSELAINLLNYVDYRNINYYICHKRIENYNDLYNPLNMVIDNKTRDIAEFIKINFMSENISLYDVNNFIENHYLTKDECILLLSRLIYPSYYFDMYEKICFDNMSEDNIEKIIKKNTQYEVFLKEIYNMLKIKYEIVRIEFLEF